MTTKEYNTLFENIVNGSFTKAPYDDEYYTNYVKLNKARTHRWEKKGELSKELKELILKIDSEQHWELITEPWCGDAANSVPLIEKMALLNPKIKLNIQLRDSNSEIDNYLTNGGKSIPKLIVRNKEDEDLLVWGPRPVEAQELMNKHKDRTDLTQDEKYTKILQWYLKDKGQSIQKEIGALVKNLNNT